MKKSKKKASQNYFYKSNLFSHPKKICQFPKCKKLEHIKGKGVEENLNIFLSRNILLGNERKRGLLAKLFSPAIYRINIFQLIPWKNFAPRTQLSQITQQMTSRKKKKNVE